MESLKRLGASEKNQWLVNRGTREVRSLRKKNNGLVSRDTREIRSLGKRHNGC